MSNNKSKQLSDFRKWAIEQKLYCEEFGVSQKMSIADLEKIYVAGQKFEYERLKAILRTLDPNTFPSVISCIDFYRKDFDYDLQPE